MLTLEELQNYSTKGAEEISRWQTKWYEIFGDRTKIVNDIDGDDHTLFFVVQDREHDQSIGLIWCYSDPDAPIDIMLNQGSKGWVDPISDETLEKYRKLFESASTKE